MVRHVPRNGAGNGALDTVNDWLMLPTGSEAWPVAGDRGGAVQDEIIPILPRDSGPKRTPRRAGTLKSRGKALWKVSLCESSFLPHSSACPSLPVRHRNSPPERQPAWLRAPWSEGQSALWLEVSLERLRLPPVARSAPDTATFKIDVASSYMTARAGHSSGAAHSPNTHRRKGRSSGSSRFAAGRGR